MILLYFLLIFDLSLGDPCCLLPSTLIWLPHHSPLCFHPGQVLLETSQDCGTTHFKSPSFTVTSEGTVISERRLCFYRNPVDLAYNSSCGTREER